MVASKFARKVIAVEASRLADLLSKNVAVNKIKNLVVIRGDIEEIESIPEQADILISQYMGFLVYDPTLLSRFLRARNRFLKPEGIMMPDSIRILISGVDYDRKKWEALKSLHDITGVFTQPIEETIPKQQVSLLFCP